MRRYPPLEEAPGQLRSVAPEQPQIQLMVSQELYSQPWVEHRALPCQTMEEEVWDNTMNEYIELHELSEVSTCSVIFLQSCAHTQWHSCSLTLESLSQRRVPGPG